MSYLGPVRLHFAGQFQAAVSTVNNDPTHFDNATFLDEFQDLQEPFDDPVNMNGWFNPRGDGSWRLLGCRVTAAWTAPATAATAGDPVLTYLVADSDQSVPAKLVDLDPEQQLVSTVFGLVVRITTADGKTTLLRGTFEPAPFTDIWARAAGGGSDIAAGAMYQSVLTDLEWGDVAGSPFLTQLRAAAADGVLSIKFQVDSFNLDFTSADFMRGRIVGTIGPASADEPHQLVLGRHFLTTSLSPPGAFFAPAGKINFCVARVDGEAAKVYLDLGNGLPTDGTSAIADIGLLTLGYLTPTSTGGVRFSPIDTLPAATYTAASWYPETAGVVALPASRGLTSDELDAVAENPLVVTLTDAQGRRALGIAEPSDGLYVRADQFVFRMSPGDHQDIRVYATSFGQPYTGARVIAVLDPSQLQGGQGVPPVGIPVEAVDFPARVTADSHGLAVLPITAADPGNPRDYIDGQVYGVRPVLEDTVYQSSPYPYNPSDFVSLLVWTGFHPTEDPVTWLGSLKPIMEQYENLYPVMKRFVRLGDYESVCDNRRMLQLAFGLDSENPNFMPVTRDLSTAKQAAILEWLARLGPDGKPLLGTAPTPAPPSPGRGRQALAPEATSAPTSPAPGRDRPGPAQGGKAAALARRLGANRSSALPTDADLADADLADADGGGTA